MGQKFSKKPTLPSQVWWGKIKFPIKIIYRTMGIRIFSFSCPALPSQANRRQSLKKMYNQHKYKSVAVTGFEPATYGLVPVALPFPFPAPPFLSIFVENPAMLSVPSIP